MYPNTQNKYRHKAIFSPKEFLRYCKKVGYRRHLRPLKGLIVCYQASIMADPETRGMSYSMKANSVLQKALKKEPDNPRAHLLIAYNIYYTPEKFGGGPVQALQKFIAAREKFDVFTPESAIHPQWGKKDADDMISLCQ